MNKSDRMSLIMREMLDIYCAKNNDYGDSFSKSFEEYGLIAPVIRLSDKLERLKSLCKTDAEVKDESVRDTLIDMANYAIMTVVEMDARDDEGTTVSWWSDGEVCNVAELDKEYTRGDQLNI